MTTALSVVMPVRDGARWLGEALASIEAALLPGFDVEVVVVDDGSVDGSRDVISSFSGRLDLCVLDGRGAGWAQASNDGLARAGGQLATFLHQDDRWHPDRLRVVGELLDRSPGASLWLHGASFIDAAGQGLGRWRLPLPGDRGVLGGRHFAERLIVQNFLCVAAPVFRRSDAGGGLRPDLWYTADWDLWLRLAGAGEVAYDARPLVDFRVHPSSQTSRRTAELDELRRQLGAVLETHLPRIGDRVAARAALLSVEVNVALAALASGQRPAARPLLHALVEAGARGTARYAVDSRVTERVWARLRAGRRSSVSRSA